MRGCHTLQEYQMMQLQEADVIGYGFRPEWFIDHGTGAPRAIQIATCSAAILSIKTHLGERWWQLGDAHARRTLGLNATKLLVKHLIRVADESADHERTVTFASQLALGVCATRRTRKSNTVTKEKTERMTTHEHMVPCEFIFQVITDKRNRERLTNLREIADVLDVLCCRALISTRERVKLDDKDKFRHTLPKIFEFDNVSFPLNCVPARLYGLIRYFQAGIVIDDLMPLTPRACELKREFLQLMAPGGLALLEENSLFHMPQHVD
jgi:hypothetical protein